MLAFPRPKFSDFLRDGARFRDGETSPYECWSLHVVLSARTTAPLYKVLALPSPCSSLLATNIESALLEAARHCKRSDEEKTKTRKNMSAKLKQLREKRHAVTDRETLKILHKEIQKVLSVDLRMICREKIKHVVSDFNNLKSISSVRANGKRKMMT